MTTSISDYYRIPDGAIRLDCEKRAGAEAGFFSFEGIPCFGRPGVPVTEDAAGPLQDCGGKSRMAAGGLTVDFDPDEVAENLRRERYAAARKGNVLHRAAYRGARAAYYALRPVLPVAIRKHFQRARSLGWQKVAFPQWPLDTTVDRLFERLLLRAMQAAGIERLPFIWFWPEGHRAAAILTHDVETRAGRDFCGRLMDLTEAQGIHSSFQVVPEQRYEVPPAYLNEIRERGFEVNIHDLNHDGSLFVDKGKFADRAAKINAYARRFGAVGFRSAVLYRNLDWFAALDFLYDMSVPNSAPLDPQRGGCCTVMPYFIGDLVELPLTTVQDYSLFHVLGTYEMELWERQIAALTARHGLMTFLVHPDYVIDSKPQSVYCRLLERLREHAERHDCWLPLPREVALWWKQRNAMKLVQGNSGWEVIGHGSERARVAWAVVQGEQLTYDLPDTPSAIERLGSAAGTEAVPGTASTQ